MNCPICNDSRMREVEKDGILIDVCPSCKGVWLDRGELDKLMNDVREVRDEYNQWHNRDRDRDDDDDRDDDRYRMNPNQRGGYPNNQQGYDNRNPNYGQGYDKHQGSYGPPHKKKKKSVLDVFGDLFE